MSRTTPKRDRDYGSRKFALTIYAVILTPILLWKGLITGEHFVTVFPLVLGLYFGGNVWQKRTESSYYSDYGFHNQSNNPWSPGSYGPSDSHIQAPPSIDHVPDDRANGNGNVGRYDPNPNI